MKKPDALRPRPIAAAALLGLARLATAQCPGHWDPSASAPGVAGGPAYFDRLVPLPNGDVAVGGNFTTVGGAVSNGLAIYHPGSDSWTAVGGGRWTFIGAGTGGTIVGVSGGQIAKLDPVSQAVTVLATLPSGWCGSLDSFAATPDGAFFAGLSGDDNGCHASILRRDPATGVWVASWGQDPSFYNECAVWNITVFPSSRVAVFTSCAWIYAPSCCPIYDQTLQQFTPSTSSWYEIFGFNNTNGPNLALLGMLALPNDDLIFCGTFPPNSAGNVARYTPESGTWSTLGGGLASPVYQLAVLPNGDIVAWTGSGLFRYHDGAAAWSPTQPSLGGAVIINAMLALPNGDLLVAGYSGDYGTETPLLARYVFPSSPPACPADFDCSGGLSVQDIFDFLNAWLAGDPRADFNGVNGITVQDIFDYLNAWFAGC